MTWLLAGSALALVLVSAVLSAADAAVFAVGRAQRRALREEGFQGAEALQAVHDRARAVRATVGLLVLLLNLYAAALVVLAATTRGNSVAAGVALALGVLAIAFLAEVVPRSLAARRPIRLALTSAPTLLAVERLAGVVFAPLVRLGGRVARLGRPDATDPQAREFMEMSELGQRAGIVDRDEHMLVLRAFRLDELTAFDVMTPRVSVFAWKDSLRLEEIIEELRTVPYSRVPVYGESIDDVTGILYVREAYKSYVAGMRDTPLSELCRDPFFVPGSLSLTQLLRDFQARRIHMGIVADEYGGTDGIVTLEDVLEELVGEIVDETDIEDRPLLRLGRSELVADASVDLREINYALNVSLPQLEHRSLNGYILDALGHVPEAGETFERSGVLIEIVAANDTQVVRARLKRLSDAEGARS